MADFEDSTSPTWANLLTGQQALLGAVAGDLAVHRPRMQRQAVRAASPRPSRRC